VTAVTPQALAPRRSFGLWDRVANDARILALLFLLPALVVLVAVVLYPFAYALILSFQAKSPGIPGRFIGIDNYLTLFSDPSFAETFINTVWYTVVAVAIKFLVGLVSAIVLNQERKFNNVYRTILFIPWAVPTVVGALIWEWVFNEFNGLLNIVLMSLGLIDSGIAWLAEPKLAMWSVIAVVVWTGTPFYTMHFLAGLQAIPKDLYEAAEIDGASIVQQFWNVTIPSMMPVFTITVMLSTVFTATGITVVNILTNGAPAGLTQILPNESYNLTTAGQMGLGSAVNMVMFPILVLLVMALTRRMLKDGNN
jgi:multiple sugar transport system permease protein